MCQPKERICPIERHAIKSARLGYYACVLAALSFVTSSIGQDRNDIRSFAYSDWNTVYDAPSGKVRASVHLRGGSGYYILTSSGARGVLSDIQYYDSFPHDQVRNLSRPSPPTPAIVGMFNLSGATGFFVFRAPDATGRMDGYSGSWVRNNGRTFLSFGGTWDGDLVERVKPAPPVVPPVVQVDPKVVDRDAPKQPVRDEQFRRELEDLKKTVRSQTEVIQGAAIETAALRKALDQSAKGTLAEVKTPLPMGYKKLPPLPMAAGVEGGTDVALSEEFKEKFHSTCLFVCRLVAKNDFVHPILGRISSGSGFGTGILVGPSLVMTCNHVVPTEEVGKSAAIEFGTGTRKVKYDLDATAIVRSSSQDKLDYSLLRVAGSEPPAERFNHYYLETSDRHRNQLLFENLQVNVIHYPRGREDRAFELRGLTLKLQSGSYVAYDANTEKGSSGAPVFNDYWWLIAIHKGKLGDPPNEMAYGISIATIIDDLRKNADQQLLVDLRLKGK